MAPLSMQCLGCEHYIYKNTKFNARKERTKETYLGVPIFSFTFLCPDCGSAIQFATDPKSRGYRVIKGATSDLKGSGTLSSNSEKDSKPLKTNKVSESVGTYSGKVKVLPELKIRIKKVSP